MIGISGSLIWSKTLMELILNPCGEFRWSLEGPVTQIHSPHLHVDALGNFLHLLRSVEMLKREWGAESNGKLPHLSISGKTAAWVPEFVVEDLPLSRTAALVPEFAVKDLPLGRTLWWYIRSTDIQNYNIIIYDNSPVSTAVLLFKALRCDGYGIAHLCPNECYVHNTNVKE